MGCPLSLSIQLSFHALRQVSMPFRRCLLKLSYHLPELPKLSFDMCCLSLSLSLSLPSSPLPPSSFHCFWEQFILPYLLLSYSFILAKPVSEPPSSLSLSILLVSKSPRGISDSLADLPLLLLKAGWLNFSFTFL